MPAKSEAQRRLFAIAEHDPGALYSQNKGLAKLSKSTLHDFASTKGLHKKKSGRGFGSDKRSMHGRHKRGRGGS